VDHPKDNATDANCEMDREPYSGLPWGMAAAVVLAAWLLAAWVACVIETVEGCK
jgi:hypothetical protein